MALAVRTAPTDGDGDITYVRSRGRTRIGRYGTCDRKAGRQGDVGGKHGAQVNRLRGGELGDAIDHVVRRRLGPSHQSKTLDFALHDLRREGIAARDVNVLESGLQRDQRGSDDERHDKCRNHDFEDGEGP